MGWLEAVISGLGGIGGGPGAAVADAGAGGLLEDAFARPESQYDTMDRDNFNVPGYDALQNRYGDYLSSVANRDAPVLGSAAQAQHMGQSAPSAFRDDQASLIQRLKDRLSGKDSLAAEQFRQGADQIAATQASLARSGTGNPAAAQRQAMMNASKAQQGAAGQAAQGRLAEMQQAGGLLGQTLAQGRGADEGLSMFNQGQGNAVNMFNTGQTNQNVMNQAQVDLAARGQNDAANLGLLGQSLQGAGMQQQGGMGYENNATTRYGIDMGVPTALDKALGATKGAAEIYATSDERIKHSARRWPGGRHERAAEPARARRSDDDGIYARPEELTRERKTPGGWSFSIGPAEMEPSGGHRDGASKDERVRRRGTASKFTTSDERSKTGEHREGKLADRLLSAMDAYTYEYKNPEMPGRGHGRRLGVMAQDVERGGPMGKSMVGEIGGVKHLDLNKAASAALALVSRLDERLRKIGG